MPAIQLFNRKCMLGGDDLQLPCMAALVLRFVQAVVLCSIIVWHLFQESKQLNFWGYLWYDTNGSEECRHSHLFPLLLFCYALSSAFWSSVSAVWELRLFKSSGVGCPTESQPRSHRVEQLLEFKLIPMSVIEFLIIVLAISIGFLSPQYYRCHTNSTGSDHLWWIAFVLLWLSQVGEVIVVLLFVQQFRSNNDNNNCSSGNERGIRENQLPLRHEHMEELWVKRCTRFCNCLGSSTCFMFGGRDLERSNYMVVARALADYFERGDIFDLVPSDIVMGMMVLQKVQKQRVLQARSQVIQQKIVLEREESELECSTQGTATQNDDLLSLSRRSRSDVSHSSRKSVYIMQKDGHSTFYESSSRTILRATNEEDLATIEEGAHFAKYQLAIYTIGLYVYQYPMTGMMRILCNARCPCCCGHHTSSSTTIYGEDWCDMHKSALLMQAGIKDESAELVFVQLKSSFHDIPYCIIVDHRWKTVVMSIRGTFSIEDCITDVMVEPERLDGLGTEYDFDSSDQFCHAGIVRCAKALMRDLKRHRLLDALLLNTASPRYLRDYRLRVVGHSLGGGAAVLLSYMLKRKHPTLRCLTYGPPGCSMSWRMATMCKEWCNSFVVDSDLVPRLTLDSMDHLRDEVLSLIGRIQIPKFEVAQTVLRSPGCCSWDDDTISQEDAIEETLETILAPSVLSTQYQDKLRHFRSIQVERKSRRGVLRSVQLYPPGRMVHLMKTGEVRTCVHTVAKCITCCTTNHGTKYTPVSIENDDLGEVVITPTLWFDHFPNRVCSVLQKMAEQYGLSDMEGDNEATSRPYSPIADLESQRFG